MNCIYIVLHYLLSVGNKISLNQSQVNSKVKRMKKYMSEPAHEYLEHIAYDTYHIWAPTRENLSSGFANNKGADQPAHPGRLINAFVIC